MYRMLNIILIIFIYFNKIYLFNYNYQNTVVEIKVIPDINEIPIEIFPKFGLLKTLKK